MSAEQAGKIIILQRKFYAANEQIAALCAAIRDAGFEPVSAQTLDGSVGIKLIPIDGTPSAAQTLEDATPDKEKAGS